MNINIEQANQLIEELIDLSDTKYGCLKVGHDTLNYDILFIEKYEQLKAILGAETFENRVVTQLPRLKNLKEIIVKIDGFISVNQNENKRMTQAVKAYKK